MGGAVVEPGGGDGVWTELGGVCVVDVASRSSSLVSHQPAAAQIVEPEVGPGVLPVGGVVVVAGVGTKTKHCPPVLVKVISQFVYPHGLWLVVSSGSKRGQEESLTAAGGGAPSGDRCWGRSTLRELGEVIGLGEPALSPTQEEGYDEEECYGHCSGESLTCH